MREKYKICDIFNAIGVFFIIASCFFIPLSTSLMGGATILACLFWLLSGKVLALPRLMANNTPILFAIALLLLLVIGTFYAPGGVGSALLYLKKYRELLFFAMTISLLMDNDRAVIFAENSFIFGCIVLLVFSYAIYFFSVPLDKHGYSTIHHITHSFFMAILAFWCLQNIFDSKQYIYFWILLFIATSINLFYITPGRTGMLIYFVLIFLTICQRLSFKKSILATVLTCLLLGVVFTTSSNFSSRVRDAIKEVQTYHGGSSRTSLGARFDWWINSIDLMAQKPVFGHGTGTFKIAQARYNTKETDILPTDNPHNEYLFIGVQTGILGLTMFIALLVSLFFFTFKLQPPRRYLLQGVVVAMACGCLMNSLLFDSHSGHFFAIISAIFCAPAAMRIRALI